MKTRLFGGIVVAALVIGATVAAVSLATASPDITRPQTIRVDAVTNEFSFLDLGHRGPSQGDEIIFHDALRRGGHTVGHDGGVCTLTSVRHGEFQCVVTMSLRDGEVTFTGLLKPGHGIFRAVFPVTGGSGIYQNVRGEAVVDQVTQRLAHITVRLIP